MSNESAVAVPAEKPLNQTQIKNLKELVEGDFVDIKAKVQREIEQRLDKRLKEIAEEFSNQDDLDAAKERLLQAGREAEDTLRALLAEITQGSVSVVNANRRAEAAYVVRVSPDALYQAGREEAEQKARTAANRLSQAARTVIDREHRTINRVILLQGITPGSAQGILNEMPDPDDVMTLVASEIQMVASDDLKVLMTSEEFDRAKALDEG